MLTDLGANIGDSVVPVAAMRPRRQVNKLTFSRYSRHTVDTVDTVNRVNMVNSCNRKDSHDRQTYVKLQDQ